jgi:hypothetical protein
MTTHQWIPPAPIQARTGPAGRQAEVTRTDPPGRTARGILILALVLGGIGAEGAVTSGHGTGDHARAHHAASNNHPEVGAHLASTVRVRPANFMW